MVLLYVSVWLFAAYLVPCILYHDEGTDNDKDGISE